MKARFFLISLILFLSLNAQTAVAPALGDGSAVNPYRIASLENLYWIAANSSEWNKYYLQTADIDAAETATWNDGDGGDPEGWTLIGNSTTYFSGIYDGNDHSITDLYIDRPSSDGIGLFGVIYDGGVKNVHLLDVNITGWYCAGGIAGYCVCENFSSDYGISHCSVSGSIAVSGNYVGGIAAYIYSSTIFFCHNSASVTGEGAVGGIAGHSKPLLEAVCMNIRQCYNEGTITGDHNIGGISGHNLNGYIYNCYNTGSLNGDHNIGGIAGTHSFIGEEPNFNISINHCYNSGTINGNSALGGIAGLLDRGFIWSSVWNTDIVGVENGVGVNNGGASDAFGKTTVEMKTQSTYTDLHWDFNGETANGTEDNWSINALYNDGYPYLTENAPSDVPTPITLTSFIAIAKNGSVELTWQTASETDNARFVIYRNDVVIGSVEGAGTSSEPHDYRFVDDAVVPGVAYTYVLADVDYANKVTKHEADAVTVTLANDFAEADFLVGAAYPNPFNPRTMIRLKYKAGSNTVVNIYNTQGVLVDELINSFVEAGTHELTWDASTMPSGVYIIKTSAGELVHSQKVALMK